jgi:hypothetical protein
MQFLFFVCHLAFAKQLNNNIEKGQQTWTFETTYTDHQNKKHSISYTLPADLIKVDLEEPLRYKKQEGAKYSAKKINEWGKTQKGVKVRASARRGKVRYSVSGKASKIRPTMKKVKKVQKQAQLEYMEREGYTLIRMGGRKGIVPDHIRHVEEYTDELKPLVKALGGPTKDPRVFGNKALAFVQNIPYEKRALVKDRYRRPLSLIGRNKGDCDSKAVLYLSLMKAAYPNMSVGVVYIKGHAFGALEIEPKKGDKVIRKDGKKYVAVEPVGPRVARVGKVGPKSRRSLAVKRYRLRTLD